MNETLVLNGVNSNGSKSSQFDGLPAEPELTTSVRRTPFTDEELEYFQNLIIEKRTVVLEDIERMRLQLVDAQEAQTDGAYTIHIGDAGDAMEREKLYLMMARQQKYVGYLDRALERVENKSYGVCKVTGEPISRERLEAVPHTEISVEAKLNGNHGDKRVPGMKPTEPHCVRPGRRR